MRNIILVCVLNLTILQFYGQSLRLSSMGQSDTTITRSDKKELVKLLGDAIRDNYYDRDGVEAIMSFLNSVKKQEEYKSQEKALDFSRFITTALREETKDPHFNLFYSPDFYKQAQELLSGAVSNTSLTRAGSGGNADAKVNYFMPKAEVLAGNVAYLRLKQMPDIRQAQKTVDAAMAFLGNSDAFILDLRGNRGGIGGFTPYMASYFFEEQGKLLFSREMPAYDSVSRFYTEKELPSARLVNQPLYVLIDAFTGSAARNLAYTLQKHGRAQLVGEETGVGTAGGHSASIFPLKDGFVATLPIANVVHPVTNSNWSMVGVVPDHATAPSEALDRAYQLILEQLLAVDSQTNKEAVKIALTELEAKMNEPEKGKSEALNPVNSEELVGRYEIRTVFEKDDQLYFQRDGQPALALKMVGNDLFEMVLPAGARTASPLPKVRFDRNEDGEVVSISFIDAGGNVLSTSKKE